MLHTLKLLLPALLPSWHFFDFIAPSPRIQFTLLSAENEPLLENREWREFRPRAARLSFPQMLGRMFWNPKWNESLFMVSCAERIMENPTAHSEEEILKRIVAELKIKPSNTSHTTVTHLQFRLLLIQRINIQADSQLHEEVVFHSRIQLLPPWGSV